MDARRCSILEKEFNPVVEKALVNYCANIIERNLMNKRLLFDVISQTTVFPFGVIEHPIVVLKEFLSFSQTKSHP